MKYSEIKDLTVDELQKRQKNMREEMFELTMKHSLGQVNNPLQIRQVRRDIAGVQTALKTKLS